MIARVRAWIGRTDELRQVHAALSIEQKTTARLAGELKRKHESNVHLLQRADVAEATVARLQADHAYVTAERCECGGDTELYWRTRAHEAERQAQRDRDSARRMADKIEYWRERFERAERETHIAEQLGRVR